MAEERVVIRNHAALMADVIGELRMALSILWEGKQTPPLLSPEVMRLRTETKVRNALELLTGSRE